MPGRDNLANWQANLTPEEQQEICRKAGKASVRKRAEKKQLGDYLLAALQAKTETGDVATDMAVSLIQEALNGNVSAFQTIRDTIGQKPKDQLEVEAEGTINITINEEH